MHGVEDFRAALRECPPGHPHRSTCINNLAISLRDRFQKLGILSDLDEVIELNRAALLLCPPGHSDRPTSLKDLALCLQARFIKRGVLSDLDEAIELNRAVLLLHPPGHSHRPTTLKNLTISLQNRFNQRGVLSDLDEAIELSRAALLLCPPGHSDRPILLNNLAISLQARFNQRGVPSDLDEAIELNRAALLLYPPNHFHRPASLSNLAISLQDRFQQRGFSSDLDEAIEFNREALSLSPPGHSDRSTSLNNLSISLQDRFQKLGILSDLDEAIELNREALSLRPPGHPDRSSALNNLAIRLQSRFQQCADLNDLNESIELIRAALELRPPGHPLRSSSLNNLAMSLLNRFQQQGSMDDLDESIELLRAALALRPFGHPRRSSSLSNLANSLRDRFQQRGILSDLDESIELHRAALVLYPAGHHYRSMSLDNLAISLRYRFQQRGAVSDLDESIQLHRAALALRPPGHSSRSSSLNSLAISLQTRFQLQGDADDLDQSISLSREALALCPPGHSERSSFLNNLAKSLQFHRRVVPEVDDLDESIVLYRTALSLRPIGHHERPSSLNDLAICLGERFHRRSILSDLDESIALHRAALALCPSGHSDRSSFLNNLALGLQTRFRQHGVTSSSDLDEAFTLYSQLSQVPHAISRSDLRAAKSWATSAERLKHNSALIAYQTALKFLEQHVALLASSPHHFNVIREFSSLAMDAFSCSIRCGDLAAAVELVEQGRAVFWTQMVRFRTLSASGGEALANDFMQLSFSLRDAFNVSTENQSENTRKLTMQLDHVISRIRMLPGLSRFLLPQLFSNLQEAAKDGPVIIVNASQYSCDALIIMSTQDPVHIPLNVTQAEVSELSSEFQSITERVGSSDHELESNKIIGVLRELWDRVVGPVVQALTGRKLIRRRSRIWWCPTAEFTLLPLHAAGPYKEKSHDGKESHNLSHFCISSYIPTLGELVRARQQVSRDVAVQHFVAVGQANPDGAKVLRCVDAELSAVTQRLAHILPFAQLADSDATVDGVVDALSRNNWLHLACHGMPDRKQPFESSFAMRDGPLTIRKIMESHWQDPEFAFLSACHTTVGDESSPDEAIHLAAAMQFSGFRSVIGSMWSVDDDVAHQVVSAFYDNMVGGSGRMDCTRAAVALHKAVKSLCMKIPLEQRIVFVHIGV